MADKKKLGGLNIAGEEKTADATQQTPDPAKAPQKPEEKTAGPVDEQRLREARISVSGEEDSDLIWAIQNAKQEGWAPEYLQALKEEATKRNLDVTDEGTAEPEEEVPAEVKEEQELYKFGSQYLQEIFNKQGAAGVLDEILENFRSEFVYDWLRLRKGGEKTSSEKIHKPGEGGKCVCGDADCKMLGLIYPPHPPALEKEAGPAMSDDVPQEQIQQINDQTAQDEQIDTAVSNEDVNRVIHAIADKMQENSPHGSLDILADPKAVEGLERAVREALESGFPFSDADIDFLCWPEIDEMEDDFETGDARAQARRDEVPGWGEIDNILNSFYR